ncbi:hypothetical protein AB0J85_19840 [Micromonospora echinofusca]
MSEEAAVTGVEVSYTVVALAAYERRIDVSTHDGVRRRAGDQQHPAAS